MKVDLTVNGKQVSASVEPRTNLADLLREHLNLTGTHLGCDQGVCGACTIVMDGVPVRSCINFAVPCAGANIRTIEAFDDDPVMVELRQAFTDHHALQCGFCTPGMLIMARDIVERFEDVDEGRIRQELSGNLCRCTGYSGIVKAVSAVVAERRHAGTKPRPKTAEGLGPAGSGHAPALGERSEAAAARRAPASGAPTPKAPSGLRMPTGAPRRPSVHQSFTVEFPPNVVWEHFADVPAMIRCIPGASLLCEDESGTYRVRMRMRMGPIGAEFEGVAEQEQDDASMVGVIRGAGRDARSAAQADGQLTYRLSPEQRGDATRVDIEIGYALSGSLAQFARGGIVKQFIATITAQFSGNLQQLMKGEADASIPGGGNELRIGESLAAMCKTWLRALTRKLFGRSHR